MRNRPTVLILLISAVGFLFFWINSQWSSPVGAPSAPSPANLPKLRTFINPQGHSAGVSTPLLDSFSYPGDTAVCDRIVVLKKVYDTDDLLDVGDCGNLSNLATLDRSARLADLAEKIPSLSRANSELSADEQDQDVALALSLLREALDILPPDRPAMAMTVLEHTWVASFASQNFPRHDPPFLFASALNVETGKAQIELCPISGRSDCDSFIPSGMIDALTEVGRWRSQYVDLLEAADLLEKRYSTLPKPAKQQELRYAQDFAGTLGYAAEIASGDQSIVLLRRAIGPLSRWLDTYGQTTDDYTLSNAVTDLGAQYGRLADRTRNKDDANKAVEYDSWAYRIRQKYTRSAQWTALCNLGDSTLLKAEIDRDEQGFKQALQHHREALAIANETGEQQDVNYAKMKLARTLLHYEQAEGVSLTRKDRIAMAKEAVATANEIIPFMQTAGTKVYLNIIRNVLAGARRDLAVLQQDAENKEK